MSDLRALQSLLGTERTQMGISLAVEMTELGHLEHHPGDPSGQIQGGFVPVCSERSRVLAFYSHTHPQLLSTRKSFHPATQREQ